eukprot:scpid80528/ scgid22805/ 
MLPISRVSSRIRNAFQSTVTVPLRQNSDRPQGQGLLVDENDVVELEVDNFGSSKHLKNFKVAPIVALKHHAKLNKQPEPRYSWRCSFYGRGIEVVVAYQGVNYRLVSRLNPDNDESLIRHMAALGVLRKLGVQDYMSDRIRHANLGHAKHLARITAMHLEEDQEEDNEPIFGAAHTASKATAPTSFNMASLFQAGAFDTPAPLPKSKDASASATPTASSQASPSSTAVPVSSLNSASSKPRTDVENT